MSAVAQRKEYVERSASAYQPRRVRRVRTSRRHRVNLWQASRFLLVVLAVASLFIYVSIYANLAVTGYNRSRLMDQCRQEKLKNERLKIQLDTLSSPHNVVAAAEKSGMVYATQYDYLSKPQTVASAVRSE